MDLVKCDLKQKFKNTVIFMWENLRPPFLLKIFPHFFFFSILWCVSVFFFLVVSQFTFINWIVFLYVECMSAYNLWSVAFYLFANNGNIIIDWNLLSFLFSFLLSFVLFPYLFFYSIQCLISHHHHYVR